MCGEYHASASASPQDKMSPLEQPPAVGVNLNCSGALKAGDSRNGTNAESALVT